MRKQVKLPELSIINYQLIKHQKKNSTTPSKKNSIMTKTQEKLSWMGEGRKKLGIEKGLEWNQQESKRDYW